MNENNSARAWRTFKIDTSTVMNKESTGYNKQFGNMAGEVLLLGRSAKLNNSNSIELLC